jgi:GTPase KRas protein
LELLDTAGQEQYGSLRDQWIKDGEGFVLVYSIALRSSFTRITKIYDQIQRIKNFSSVPITLVGNKSDVMEREVSTQEGHALARELGCEFVEVSAKDNKNIEKAFVDIVRLLRRRSRQISERGKQPRRASGSESEEEVVVAARGDKWCCCTVS